MDSTTVDGLSVNPSLSQPAICLHRLIAKLSERDGEAVSETSKLGIMLAQDMRRPKPYSVRSIRYYLAELRRAEWIETQTNYRYLFMIPTVAPLPRQARRRPTAPRPFSRPHFAQPLHGASPVLHGELPSAEGGFAPPLSSNDSETVSDSLYPDDNKHDTTASDTKTTAADSERVVVSKEERETVKEAEPATVTPRNIPSPISCLHERDVTALIAEIAALASIPATDAARAVSLDPAQARNAAQAAHEVKEKREPIRLFWALYWRKAMPNPPPDPKPARIATEGAKTVHHRPVVESVGGLTGWAACEMMKARLKTAGRTERART